MHHPHRLTPEFRAKLLGLDEFLNSELFGQSHAIYDVVDSILRAETGVSAKPGRPLSFQLFLGPTGVGKTELCLLISSYLWGSDCIARLNMAEFSDANSVGRVIGRGIEYPTDEGRLGTEIRQLRASGGKIVLLDEIEKADPKVSDVFLGMEAAEVAYGNGRKEKLNDLHFVVTSNLGTAIAADMAKNGQPRKSIQEALDAALSGFFRKEVIGRFTKVVLFDPLTKEGVARVGQKFIRRVLTDLVTRMPQFAGCELKLSPSVGNIIAAAGRDISMGARPVRSASENFLEAAAARYLLHEGYLWGLETSVGNVSVAANPTSNTTVNTALAAVASAWNSTTYGRTNLSRLVITRITQEKFSIAVKLPTTASNTIIPCVGGFGHSVVAGDDQMSTTPSVTFPAFHSGAYGILPGETYGTVGVSGATILLGDRVPSGRKIWLVMGANQTDVGDPTGGGSSYTRLTSAAETTRYTITADMVHEWY